MPDLIGNITVPEIVASGTFPIVPDYPFGRSSHPDVAIHQFGSGNAKIEQRFLLGDGAKRFTVRRAWMNDAAAHRAPELLGVEVRPVRRVHLQRAERRWQRHDRVHLPVRQRAAVLGDGCRLGLQRRRHAGRDPGVEPHLHAVHSRYPLPLDDAQGRTAAAGAADDSADQDPAAPERVTRPSISPTGAARSARSCTCRAWWTSMASRRAWGTRPTTPRSPSATPIASCATSRTTWTCSARPSSSRSSTSARRSSSTCGRATSSTGSSTPGRSSRSPPPMACTN